MKLLHLLLLAAMAFATELAGAELREVHCLGKVSDPRGSDWHGRVEFVSWLDDDTILYSYQNGPVVCWNLRTSAQKWKVDNVSAIDQWSVSRTGRRLAMLCRDEHNHSIRYDIRIFDAANGKLVRHLDRHQLEQLLELSFALPFEIALTPNDARLVVCVANAKDETKAFVLDPEYKQVDTSIDIDARLWKMSISSDGSRATHTANADVVCIREIKTNREIYVRGDRSAGLAIDAPLVSDARHDGKQRLVYTTDNSWNTGKVTIVDLKCGASRSFDARNGHIEMDVDFARERIALSGTSKNLTLINFNGAEIAHLPNATEQRNVGVEFSPSGKQIAVASGDNTVSVFSILE